MIDTVEEFEGALIQRGAHNDRIYLHKLISDLSLTIPIKLIDLAKKNNYSKVFIKIPAHYLALFLDAGYQKEAVIPSFYSGNIDAVFMGFYLNDDRARCLNADKLDDVLKIAKDNQSAISACQLDKKLNVRSCDEADIDAMVNIYKEIFQSYPFPIHDPAYLLDTMKNDVSYFGVEFDRQLVAISSAEMDMTSLSAEMTDFATRFDWQGNGFAQALLHQMEKEMKQTGIKTVYTIARALSVGMNVTFSKSGYQFGGRLINNTNISGSIESMNVWYKPLIDC